MNAETMTPFQVVTIEEMVGRIQAALASEHWDFRTVGGIARDTGLPPTEVERVLEDHPNMFRRSYLRDDQGHAVYTLRGKPATVRERIAELRDFIASPVTYRR